MKMRTRTALVGGLVVLSMALGGCSALQGLFGQNVTRDAQTQEVTEAGTAGVFSLHVGDCFNEQGSAEEISDVPAVPCADAHDNEIYYAFTIDGTDWPGDEVINTKSEEECGPKFEEFVGIAYADSTLDWWPMTPTQGSWENGNDREVLCIVYEASEAKVQGSLAGVAR
jgi:hypothetical protein